MLRAMEEDKKERELRSQQAALVKEAATSSASAAAAEHQDSSTSTLCLRDEEGALRHQFPADATLADVRTWLEETRRQQASIPSTSHVLVSNEVSELARQGRENFERQTARLREQARAMRMGAEGGAPVTYFVTTMPRRDFLTEEAMGTTLAEAGLVPHGTLMVRRAPRRGAAA